jgi:hypothetical protein
VLLGPKGKKKFVAGSLVQIRTDWFLTCDLSRKQVLAKDLNALYERQDRKLQFNLPMGMMTPIW